MRRIVFILLLLSFSRAWATSYFMSATGSDSADGLTTGTAWLTPNHTGLNCGDSITAASGDYNAMIITAQPTCAIHDAVWVKCATFDTCKITSTGPSSQGLIDIQASNWAFTGWELHDPSAFGTNSVSACFAIIPKNGGPGIHDVYLLNDIANGCMAGGFNADNNGANSVDYIVYGADVAYNASQSSAFCYSGFNVLQPQPFDTQPGTHIYMTQLFPWNNVEPAMCNGTAPTDGEGIILDTFTGIFQGFPPYDQRAVVTDSLAIYNGSAGMGELGSGNKASNIIFSHNTAADNFISTTLNTSLCGQIESIGFAPTNPDNINRLTTFTDNLATTTAATLSGCASNPAYPYMVGNVDNTTTIAGNAGYSPASQNIGTIGTVTGFAAGTNAFGANPGFTNTTMPAAPNCTGKTDVIDCMSSVIADFAPTNSALFGYGYRKPQAISVVDPAFPQFLCNNANMPTGLMTMGCGQPAPVTDNFTGTTLSSNWTINSGGFSVSSGTVEATSATENLAIWTANTFSNDQTNCMVLTAANGNGSYIGPTVRTSLDGQNFYMALIGPNFTLSQPQINIQSKINGVFSTIKNGPFDTGVFTNYAQAFQGHTYCLSVQGSLLTVTDNGVAVIRTIDTHLTSGTLGIRAFNNTGQGIGQFTGYSGTPVETIAANVLSVPNSLAQATVTITGTYVNWQETPPSFSISGQPAGTSLTSCTVSDPVTALCKLVTGSTAGSITISDGTASTTIGQIATKNWFIRADGGTRYDANQLTGQCNGLVNAAYPGSGTNQACAYNDWRWLYDDQTFAGVAKWVINGGDTVIVPNTYPSGAPGWRVGWAQGTISNDVWCPGLGNLQCFNPPIPPGVPEQHTQFLGTNHAACSTGTVVNKSALSQLFGGFEVNATLNLDFTSNVDVQCLDITQHDPCINHGSPAVPSQCSSSLPLSDSGQNGVFTSAHGSENIFLQDMWIHGFPNRGVIGGISGTLSCLRCSIQFNGTTGWDFDDGTDSNTGQGTPSPAPEFLSPNTRALWTFTYGEISWNGCNQEQPMVDPIPVGTCYDQDSQGQGDGVGTPPFMCMNFDIEHNTGVYNTQEFFDLGHLDGTVGPCNGIYRFNIAYGNMGENFKWGTDVNISFTNNISLANGWRMSQPITGVHSGYNTYLSDWCRAGCGMSWNTTKGVNTTMQFNTFVGYPVIQNLIGCNTSAANGNCVGSTITFQNNIVLGYDNPSMYVQGGQSPGPTPWYCQDNIDNVVANCDTVVTWARSNNIYYTFRALACPTGYTNENCTSSPQLTNQPTGNGGTFVETELDNFNFQPASGSPVLGAGIPISGVPTDYAGVTRPNPPAEGALEHLTTLIIKYLFPGISH